MNKKRRFLVLLIVVLTVITSLFGCGSSIAGKNDMTIGRNGKAEVTVTLKRNGKTDDEIRKSVDEYIAGVNAVSAFSETMKLRKLEIGEEFYSLSLNTRRIDKVDGTGRFYYDNYEASVKEGSDVRSNTIRLLADGKIKCVVRKYFNGKSGSVEIDKTDLGDGAPILPINAASGKAEELKDFYAHDYSGDNFVLAAMTILDVDGLEKITVTVKGKILHYAGVNAELVSENSVAFYATRAQGVIVTASNDATEDKETGESKKITTPKNINCLTGYIVYEKSTSPWAIVLWIATGILITGVLTLVFVRRKKIAGSKSFKYILRNPLLYLMLVPGLLSFILFNYKPMAGLVVMFENYSARDGMFGSEFVGLYWFRKMFADPLILRYLRNTVCIAGLKFIFGFPGAIILALLINELRNKAFKKVVQTISYLPYFLSWIIVSSIAYSFLSKDTGIINNVIVSLGGARINWYAKGDAWWGIFTVTHLWKTLGWGTIMYLAALSSVNSDLYEAAKIDGANRWQQTLAVTLPAIVPMIMFQLIMSVGSLLSADFDQIAALTGNSNYAIQEYTDVFSTVIYRIVSGGSTSQFSYATTMDFVNSTLSLILVLVVNAIVKKKSNIDLI